MVESSQAWLEAITFQLNTLTSVQQVHLAGTIALCKAQVTQTMQLCAQEAAQIFGGRGFTEGGMGGKVEQYLRAVKGFAVPGGAEEVMLDLGVRQALKRYPP